MSQRNRASALLWICAIAALIASSVSAQDWPQWRGPNRDAKTAAITPPQSWPKEIAPKWKINVGEGVATPALVGDKLYVFSRQDGNEITRCLNASTGDEIWQDKYESQGASGPASSFSGPRSSPAVADGKVVTLGVRGVLSCLNAADGKKIWRKDDFQGAVPNFFAASSPIITDGLVIAQLGGRDNGALVAYDLNTGDQKWKWAGDSPAYSSPALMTVGGAKLIIAMTEKKIVAVSAADGKQVWETPFAAQGMGGYNACTPIVDGQTLIYSGGGRGTHAVKIDKDGDAYTAKELWTNPDKSVQFNTPVVKDGVIYGVTAGNELFAIDEKSGQTLWTGAALAAGGGGPGGPGGPRPGGAGPGGPPGGGPPPGGGGGGGGRRRGGGGMGRGGYGSVVDAGPLLLALTPASELVVFQPGEKYSEVTKIKIASTPTYAYPVVSGNRIFVKDQDSVALLPLE